MRENTRHLLVTVAVFFIITVITELLINNIIIKYIKFNIAADPTLFVHEALQHVKPTYHPWKPKVTSLCLHTCLLESANHGSGRSQTLKL